MNSKAKSVSLLSLLLCSMLMFGFLGFGEKKGTIAKVDGECITQDDLQARLKTFPPQYAAALQQKENKIKVLDQMIDEKLVIVAAKKAGIAKSKDYKDQIEAAENQLLVNMFVREKIDKNATVSDAEVASFYQKNPNQFKELEQRHAAHILVKTEAEAIEVLKALKNGADFGALAKTKSTDPSAANGGDLGWFARGQLVPAFEKAAFELAKGKTSGIIKTQFGFHIIKMIDIQVRPKVDFTPQTAQQIKDALLGEKKRALTTEYLGKLRKEIKIKKDVAKIN